MAGDISDPHVDDTDNIIAQALMYKGRGQVVKQSCNDITWLSRYNEVSSCKLKMTTPICFIVIAVENYTLNYHIGFMESSTSVACR